MRSEYLNDLVSSVTGLGMRLESVKSQEHDEIKEGILVDESGTHTVSIRNFIPRFVTDEAYTDRFGEMWNRYRAVQIDSENKFNLSAERFYRWTGWTKDELRGLRILEAGCGAGRFTQVMLEAGATVYALDMSAAVDACWHTNGPHSNLCLLQADIYKLPWPTQFFDRIFCYGVLQYTPNPRQAFMSLIPFLRPRGKISVDCYRKQPYFTRWTSKYHWRPITKRLPARTLFKIVEWYIPKWLPIDTRLARVPRIGSRLVGIIPCWNYTGRLPFPPEQITAWAILDTFDSLAPKYDHPQTLDEVRRWFDQAGLSDIRVERGSNGIVGNAVKSSSVLSGKVGDSQLSLTG
jgi:2-polyprenyl-3-methyl-5-hydroxy-6-metoxy-1,4-benzoquinol methylase